MKYYLIKVKYNEKPSKSYMTQTKDGVYEGEQNDYLTKKDCIYLSADDYGLILDALYECASLRTPYATPKEKKADEKHSRALIKIAKKFEKILGGK